MAKEEGIIIKYNKTTAMVKTIQSTACDSCSEKDVCKTTGGGKIMEVEAINTANAKLGDLVVVSFDTGQLFMLSFMLYVFPIIAMIIGALFGEHIAKNFNANPSTFSAIFGFSFFFISMGIVKLKDKKARKSGKYRPEIIKIKRKAQPGCPVSPVAAGE
ncbi:MAG: SoxR reducing system RseC family protein [Dissulfuribacterales bacterium]